jgi:hypothetical protein
LQLAITASAQTAASEEPATTPAPAEPPATAPAEPPATTPAASATPAASEAPAVTPAPAKASAPSHDVALPPVATESVLLPSEKGRQGFDLLAKAAFGKATDQAYGLDIEPYGANFGLDSGYTWAFGLRLGVSVDYGLGRTLHQVRDPRIGRTNEVTTQASALNSALSIGHDLWLRFLILRYSWSFGVSWMSWDFTSVPPSTIHGYASSKGSTAGFYAAPGLAVLWPLGHFTCGLGFDYVIQTKNQIPSGILPKLLVGVKL